MRVCFAPTLELSRATTTASALGALKVWTDATDRFGVDLMQNLVSELNVDGLEEGGEPSSKPAKVAILLEYAPKTMNDAGALRAHTEPAVKSIHVLL